MNRSHVFIQIANFLTAHWTNHLRIKYLIWSIIHSLFVRNKIRLHFPSLGTMGHPQKENMTQDQKKLWKVIKYTARKSDRAQDCSLSVLGYLKCCLSLLCFQKLAEIWLLRLLFRFPLFYFYLINWRLSKFIISPAILKAHKRQTTFWKYQDQGEFWVTKSN